MAETKQRAILDAKQIEQAQQDAFEQKRIKRDKENKLAKLQVHSTFSKN